MGCRKNAYRALTELSEWMEAQREKADAASRELQAAQRRFWTPVSVLDQCCPKWLADGPEIQRGRHQTQAGVGIAAMKGCSGGCGKEHPRIVLEWEGAPKGGGGGGGCAVACLSHELDPFVNYFENLCIQGLAERRDNNQKNKQIAAATTTTITPKRCYQLKGFLKDHLDKLHSTAPFDMHLVKAPSSSLAASQRAHRRHAEQEVLEREAKRRKIQGPAAAKPLLERVLEICYQHSLSEHLDVAEISWMRLTCKTMAKIAARMARERLESLRLCYSVLLDGRELGSDNGFGVFLTEEEKEGNFVLMHGTREMYDVVASKRALKRNSKGEFMDADDRAPSFESSQSNNFAEITNDNYHGHVVRLFLEPITSTTDGKILPEKHCLFSKLVEVARYRSDPRREVTEEGLIETGASSKLLYRLNDAHHPESMERAKRLLIEQFKFGFHDLVGIYVRRKLPLARARMHELQKDRPVTSVEKQYVKALAKAAREAPGTSRDFEGLEGW